MDNVRIPTEVPFPDVPVRMAVLKVAQRPRENHKIVVEPALELTGNTVLWNPS
jgi:hypothetical protein